MSLCLYAFVPCSFAHYDVAVVILLVFVFVDGVIVLLLGGPVVWDVTSPLVWCTQRGGMDVCGCGWSKRACASTWAWAWA